PSPWSPTSPCAAAGTPRGDPRPIRYTEVPDVQPVAADRAAPGQGRETSSVHRNGTRGSGAGPPARRRVLAPRVPRYVRGGAPQPGPADPLRDPERTRRCRRRTGVRAVGRPGS